MLTKTVIDPERQERLNLKRETLNELTCAQQPPVDFLIMT